MRDLKPTAYVVRTYSTRQASDSIMSLTGKGVSFKTLDLKIGDSIDTLILAYDRDAIETLAKRIHPRGLMLQIHNDNSVERVGTEGVERIGRLRNLGPNENQDAFDSVIVDSKHGVSFVIERA